jgi:hypothetical protein
MAQFLDLVELGIPNGYMGYIEYQNLSGQGKEILWDATWDIDIPIPPRAVPWPGLDLLKTRLISMDFDINKDLAGTIDVNIRGFHVIQHAGFESNGSITLNFIDFEDQIIYGLAMAFMQIGGANRYKYFVRKEDMIIPELHIYFLNSSRLPVRKITLYTLVFKSYEASYATTTMPEGGRGEITMSFDFEHHDITILNVNPAFTF